jgi:hypothetical protein
MSTLRSSRLEAEFWAVATEEARRMDHLNREYRRQRDKQLFEENQAKAGLSMICQCRSHSNVPV